MSNLPTLNLPDWQAARLAQLLDAATGVTLTQPEYASLAWLAGFEADTVAHVASVIRRARGLSGERGATARRSGSVPPRRHPGGRSAHVHREGSGKAR